METADLSVCFAQQPFSCILYESVLHRTLENLVAVAHVHVEHLVLGIGPHHWNIPVRQQALDPEWVVCGIKRQQYMDVAIRPRTGLPAIPLIGWRDKGFRKISRDRTRL